MEPCRASRFLSLVVSVLFLSLGPLERVVLGASEKDEKKKEPAQGAASEEPPPRKPFAEVVKNAQVIQGVFTFYRKDEKVFLELAPSHFDKVHLCSLTLESGIGERGFYGATEWDHFPIAFRRLGTTVQFVRKNARYTADPQNPIHEAVMRSYSDSILGTAGIESQPHPERKSVLIDISRIFVSDIPMIGWYLELEYRWPYKLDAGTSGLGALKAFPQNVEIDALLNYAIERPPVPPLAASGTPAPAPMPAPPVAPPDVRSVPLRVRYSLSSLPETGYRPRLADDRVGYFLTMRQDFSDDRRETPYLRYLERWHLEKADPQAPLSPPKEPIVLWLEKTIPEKYRAPLSQGALLWNEAFERIGFKNVIVVKQQAADADWDPADVRYSTIRWFTGRDGVFAAGFHRANPFTGQVYDADVIIGDEVLRNLRGEFRQLVSPAAGTGWRPLWRANRSCDLGEGLAQEVAFGFSLLQARGMLPDPKAEDEYVAAALVQLAAHEVGHVLGLRHNFRASLLNGSGKLEDPATEALSGSVMDYNPVNLAPKGKRQGRYAMSSLGPYDHLAIEYGYAPLSASDPEAEQRELRRIAARGASPELSFGTDEDVAYASDGPIGMDPRVNQWDLGEDPLAFYAQRVALVRELWTSLETASAKEGETFESFRRVFESGFWEHSLALRNATRYVGGIHHNREHVGDAEGRLPYEPVPALRQRQALALLTNEAFGRDAFRLPAAVLNKLAIDRFESFENPDYSWHRQRLDYPIHERVLRLQQLLMDSLYHPVRLARLQDLPLRHPSPADAFTMVEMFRELRKAIWSELEAPPGAVEITSFRRATQREHLKRLMALVLRPSAAAPEDATTLARLDLTELKTRIARHVVAGGRMDEMARAHLLESAARMDETLKAQQQRATP